MNMKEQNAFFPVFLDLTQKKIVVAGAGNIAARRVRSLLDFAGEILVVAPEIHEDLLPLNGNGTVRIEQRTFAWSDLEGADLVLAATDDPDLNQRIGSCCRERGILVNTSHDKSFCDFYFPGIARKDNVVIGITASGADHVRARKVTEAVRQFLDESEEL